MSGARQPQTLGVKGHRGRSFSSPVYALTTRLSVPVSRVGPGPGTGCKRNQAHTLLCRQVWRGVPSSRSQGPGALDLLLLAGCHLPRQGPSCGYIRSPLMARQEVGLRSSARGVGILQLEPRLLNPTYPGGYRSPI